MKIKERGQGKWEERKGREKVKGSREEGENKKKK